MNKFKILNHKITTKECLLEKKQHLKGKLHIINFIVFKDTIMNNSNEEKMLDATTDNRLTFSSHTRELHKKNFSRNIAFIKNIKQT